jgi:hypothetical protein
MNNGVRLRPARHALLGNDMDDRLRFDDPSNGLGKFLLLLTLDVLVIPVEGMRKPPQTEDEDAPERAEQLIPLLCLLSHPIDIVLIVGHRFLLAFAGNFS